MMKDDSLKSSISRVGSNQNGSGKCTSPQTALTKTVWWRRWLVILLLVVAFALLIYFTPNSSKEEGVVVFIVAWVYVAGKVQQMHALSNERVVTLGLSVGALGVALSAAIIACAREVVLHGWIPSLPRPWAYIIAGYLCVTIIYWLWNIICLSGSNRANSALQQANKAHMSSARQHLKSPQPPSESDQTKLGNEPDWDAILRSFGPFPEAGRLSHLVSLRRLHAFCSKEVVLEEVETLKRESLADIHTAENDALSQMVMLLEWGTQKLPELVELDISDLFMAKVIADINRLSTGYETIFVSYKSLRPIHAINRGTANKKCNDRAASIKSAIPLLQANGMRLSELLIEAEASLKELQSVNGFQVVRLVESDGGGYVTFEGNGRREALNRALEGMPDVDLLVEVRLFQFADEMTTRDISKQVQECRQMKGVSDQ